MNDSNEDIGAGPVLKQATQQPKSSPLTISVLRTPDACFDNLPLWDYEQCCKLCVADARCAVASLHHGSATAPYFFCELKATAKKPAPGASVFPNLSLSCMRKKP